MRTEIAVCALFGAALCSCGGTGVTAINDPNSGSSDGSAYFRAKCKSELEDCLADARNECGGAYTVVHKESHAGGLLADALPGPVTWYTITFRCGASGDQTAIAAQQDALRAFVLPTCQADWEGRCGLLIDNFEHGTTIDAPALAIERASEGQVAGGTIKIAARACGERPDALSEPCIASFRKSFIASLRKRYPHANDPRLLSWCDHHPSDCEPENAVKLRLLEMDFLAAHDRAVFAAFRRATHQASIQQGGDVARAADEGARTHQEEAIRRTREKLVQDAVRQMNEGP